MNDLTIIMPVYNEEASLRVLIPELLEFCADNGFDLIVVNDGSVDDTRKILEGHGSDPRLTTIHNKVNKGYGGAIKAGIEKADTRHVITLDGDGQHYLEDVLLLHQVMFENDADMIVGRRTGIDDHWYRRLGKGLIRGIAKMLMPIDIRDLNSGMKIYDTALAKKYIKLCPDGMAYSDIITLVFIKQKHLVKECDIKIRQRNTGVSTISTKTAFDTVLEIINVVILFNPLRIFLPVAVAFLLVGTLWGLPFLLRGEGISIGTLFMIISGLIFFLLGLLAEQLSLIRRDQVNSGN
ncbi:MAG TPA: glycosyltransferase family 2 protein [Acidiferrobacteraceae bacterium]|nr:glycosyltransferase family 2 protein [Acidiferrobacteraceae bacterium]